MCAVSSLQVQAALVVASLDLKMVQLLRDAMGAADLAAGAIPGPLGTIIKPDTYCAHDRIEPRPIIEPRKRIEPEPRFEPRKVLHPTPRFEPRPVYTEAAPMEAQPVKDVKRSLPPLWEMPISRPPTIKVTVIRHDVISKGSLLDLFI